jgi:hypothetical protein
MAGDVPTMPTPDWSDEHVSRANRFTLHVVLVWVSLVVLQAMLLPTGSIGMLLTGVFALGAAWLLVHSLFTQVDELVRTRLDEADDLTGGGLTDGREGDRGASD